MNIWNHISRQEIDQLTAMVMSAHVAKEDNTLVEKETTVTDSNRLITPISLRETYPKTSNSIVTIPAACPSVSLTKTGIGLFRI